MKIREIHHKIYLDTNSFYDFIKLFGVKNLSIKGCQNSNIKYCKFKRMLKLALKNKLLFIPPPTMFEFCSKFRFNLNELQLITRKLTEISKKYKYDLFEYSSPEQLFSFDKSTDKIINKIKYDYNELCTMAQTINRGKIGAESWTMAYIAKLITLAFLLDYYYEDPEVNKHFNSFLTFVTFSNNLEHAIYKSTAHQLNYYYLNKCDGKMKKSIFENTLKLTFKLYSEFLLFPSKKSFKVTSKKNNSRTNV